MHRIRKPRIQFHIHANIFSCWKEVEHELKAIGFKSEAARRFDEDKIKEFRLNTYKTDENADAKDVWQRMLAATTGKKGIEGYGEMEVLVLGIGNETQDEKPIKKPKYTLHAGRKRADVHIRRTQKRDGLDDGLLQSGFYEVEIENPFRRIFTLQTSTVRLARDISEYWRAYATGRIDGVYYEIVPEIVNFGSTLWYVDLIAQISE